MTGDAMEIYYHRVSCRPFPFGVLLPKGGELGICFGSCLCVFVFVRVSCLMFVSFIQFHSLLFGCESDHMV